MFKRIFIYTAMAIILQSTAAIAAPAVVIGSELSNGIATGAVEIKTTSPDLTNNKSPLACSGKLKYLPWPAFSAENYTKYSVQNGAVLKTPKNWPTTPNEVNKLLPNISTQITKISKDDEVKAAGFFGARKKSMSYAIDFMKYRSEAIEDGTGKVFAYGRIGAGMRLVVEIETTEGSLDGNLFAIAASAKAGKTTGTISADIIGLDGNDITLSVPFTTDLSEGSIQKIVEALAVVKTKFRDTNTTIKPQFIARIDCSDNAEVSKPKEEVKKS